MRASFGRVEGHFCHLATVLGPVWDDELRKSKL
jgi:hypothetical protein